MPRREHLKSIDSFLKNISTRPPLDQLAAIEANSGIKLPGMASNDRLNALSHYRSISRLLTYARPGTGKIQTNCLKVLQASVKVKNMPKLFWVLWSRSRNTIRSHILCFQVAIW